jgi:hypothetical protein|tara:strand:+ start:9303 stop:10481 length:1179 start_codon:yes stop_codon:yes gene_type:complete
MTDKRIDRRSFLKGATLAAAALGTPAAAAAEGSPTTGAVPTRQLGRTGIQVPIIQLGTSQRLDAVYDKKMHLCYREGVKMIDTALVYGWGASHRAIANFLQQVDDRKNMFLTSKSESTSISGLRKGLDECLEELQIDNLDLYLMHNATNPKMVDPQFIKLGDELRKSGKTNLFGFSCHGRDIIPVMSKAARVGGIDVILFRYNFRQYGDLALNRAIDACQRAGIGLIAMKAMASVPPELERVVEFRSNNFTLAQAKLKSIWADERINCINSEMDNVQRVRENIGAAKSTQELTAGESHQLNRLAALTANYYCNGCASLCEKAAGHTTAIADPLRYLMYYECYGKRSRAKELYAKIPDHLKGFEPTQIVKAETACPQGISIGDRLTEARILLS